MLVGHSVRENVSMTPDARCRTCATHGALVNPTTTPCPA